MFFEVFSLHTSGPFGLTIYISVCGNFQKKKDFYTPLSILIYIPIVRKCDNRKMGEMNFNEFCGNTSLHGWRFVPGTAGTGKFGIVGRAIWIFIVVSSIGVAAFFIAVALNDFFSSTGKLRF